MENQALEIWSQSAAENVVGSPNELSVCECILHLGRDIFHLSDDISDDLLSTIIESIEDHFALSSNTINADNIHKQLKYCLIAAVSQSCENQSSYIQNILSLESEYQTVLMEIIKTGTSDSESSNQNDNNESDVELENELMTSSNDINKSTFQQEDINKSKYNLCSEETSENTCDLCFEKNVIISNHIKSRYCNKYE